MGRANAHSRAGHAGFSYGESACLVVCRGVGGVFLHRLDALESAGLGLVSLLSFENGAQLANHVDAFINRAMSQLQQRVDDDLTSRQYFETVTAAGERPSPPSEGDMGASAAEDPSRGVWPRVESTERPETDSSGRLRTKRNWYLVLSNQTRGPVRNVRYEYVLEDGAVFDLQRQQEPIRVMPPGGEARLPMLLTMGSRSQAECRVTWEGPDRRTRDRSDSGHLTSAVRRPE